MNEHYMLYFEPVKWKIRVDVIAPKDNTFKTITKELELFAPTKYEAAFYASDVLVIDIVERKHGFSLDFCLDLDGQELPTIHEYTTMRDRTPKNRVCTYVIY